MNNKSGLLWWKYAILPSSFKPLLVKAFGVPWTPEYISGDLHKFGIDRLEEIGQVVIFFAYDHNGGSDKLSF